MVLPVVAVPYLARVLGPGAWGLVVFAQSFALWLTLWVEFGFNLSGTREVAMGRADAKKVSGIVADVWGAKAMLIIPAALVTLAAGLLVTPFREHPEYLWLALLTAVMQGLSPLWYFQGIERMGFPAAVDVAMRIVAVGGIFVIVKGVDDGWKVLALQGGAGFASVVLGMSWMYRSVDFAFPRVSGALRALQMGWSMFLFRSSVSLYTTANAFILGLMVPTAQVAFFGGAEKLVKVAVALLSPVSQAFYPRLARLARHDSARAVRLVRVSFGLMVGMALVGAVLLVWLAPTVIRLALGPGYEGAVPVLRVLAAMVPLVAASNVLGIQWMLPLRMDRSFNRIVVTAGALNLVLAVTLASTHGAVGMAVAVLCAEAFVAAAMGVAVSTAGKAFWTSAPAVGEVVGERAPPA
jgi:PST family polysaccharide transporter